MDNINIENEFAFSIRKCKNFDPVKHLYPRDPDENGVVRYDIRAADRVLWFHIYCEENGIKPYIDDSEVHYFAECGLIIGTATVYMNGEPVGKASASFPYDPGTKTYEYAAATVGTYARSRALSNAGFGPLSNANHLESGEIINPDMGIQIPASAAGSVPFTVGDDKTLSESCVSIPSVREDKPVELSITDKLKQMMLIEVPIGKYKGKLLSDINCNEDGRKFINWYANKENAKVRFPEFLDACRFIDRYNSGTLTEDKSESSEPETSVAKVETEEHVSIPVPETETAAEDIPVTEAADLSSSVPSDIPAEEKTDADVSGADTEELHTADTEESESVSETVPEEKEEVKETVDAAGEELEKSFNTVVPTGVNKGKTLRDINSTDAGKKFIVWFVDKSGLTDKYPEFTTACRVVYQYDVENFLI